MKRRCALIFVFFALVSVPLFSQDNSEVVAGLASWYGEDFHGKLTANGEVYDMTALTAAHRTLPFGTRVKVVNLLNNRWVVVRINDRGPFKEERIIDVSKAAAEELDFIRNGIAPVRIEILINNEERSPCELAVKDKKPQTPSLCASEKVVLEREGSRPNSQSNTQERRTLDEQDKGHVVVKSSQVPWEKPVADLATSCEIKNQEQNQEKPKENIVYIQVGSYQEKANALRTAILLADSGFKMQVRQKNGYYRVFFEQELGRVNESLRLLQNRGYQDPLVRRTPVEGVEIDWLTGDFFE